MQRFYFLCPILLFLSCFADSIEDDEALSKALSVQRYVLLTDPEISLLQNDPKEALDLYAKKKEFFRKALGPPFSDLNEEERFVIFCLLSAHYLRPYGTFRGGKTSFFDLLASSHLNCGQYGLLGLYLAESVDETILKRVPIHFIGWGPPSAFGTHQTELLYKPESEDVFIDPTAAVVARVDYDAFTSGKRVKAEKMVSFFVQEPILWFYAKVINTFLDGAQKPSALQYYHGSMRRYLRDDTKKYRWVTPSVQRGFVYPIPDDDHY